MGFSLYATSWITVSGYGRQWLLCLFSCVLIAFGVYLEVRANLLMLAGESVMLAVSKVFRIDFGRVKLGFDCSQVLLGVVFSLLAFHGLVGLREGTVFSAVFVGNLVRVFNKVKIAHTFLKEDSECMDA